MVDIVNAFTVDVEDYFQVSAFEKYIRRDKWDSFPSRVVASTHRMLRLLDRYQVRATFFVLGWVASRYPQLVEDIRDRGHELGSHGFWHRLVYRQSPHEFRIDLRDSVHAIEDAAGVRVSCYRAPSFSITKLSEWALEILVEEGIEVDSSIYPVRHERYGMPYSDANIHRRETNSGPIVEFPLAVLRTRFWNMPVSGGGYFRLYPLRLTISCLEKINRSRHPYVFYVHPWEIDPDQPKLPINSRLKTWRHRVNLKTTYSKLDILMRRFRFSTMSETIRQSVSPVSLPREQCKKAHIQMKF